MDKCKLCGSTLNTITTDGNTICQACLTQAIDDCANEFREILNRLSIITAAFTAAVPIVTAAMDALKDLENA